MSERLQSEAGRRDSNGAPGLNPLGPRGVFRGVKRGTILYSPGQLADCVYSIQEGFVNILRHSPDGRELILDSLGPGEVFGHAEVVLGMPRENEAVARTDVGLHALERRHLLANVHADPRVGLWLAQRMAQRQSRLECRMQSLVFKSAQSKVAEVLVSLAEDYGRKVSGGILIDYPITHQEIGNLTASSRETVSYAFMEFRARGLLSTQRRRTIVHDLSKLGEVAAA
jgi:CRP-like cAMP-binding protein